jgi:hypothetical protein
LLPRPHEWHMAQELAVGVAAYGSETPPAGAARLHRPTNSSRCPRSRSRPDPATGKPPEACGPRTAPDEFSQPSRGRTKPITPPRKTPPGTGGHRAAQSWSFHHLSPEGPETPTPYHAPPPRNQAPPRRVVPPDAGVSTTPHPFMRGATLGPRAPNLRGPSFHHGTNTRHREFKF